MTSLAFTRRPRPKTGGSALAEALLLWVPNAQRPGLTAFAVFLARVTILPTAGAFVLLAPFARVLPQHPLLGIAIMLAGSVLVEECGRFAVVRRAIRPVRSLTLFTVLIIAVETLTYWRPHASALVNILLRLPSMGVHVLAGATMLWGLRRPNRLVATLATIYALHLAFDIGSVAMFGDSLAHSKALGGAVATQSQSASSK